MSIVEPKKKRFLQSFTVYDLILLAMLTALSIACKLIVGTLVRTLTGSIGIPGGALAGGFYMFWLPIAVAITGKRGSALLIAAVQTLVLLVTGAPGSHGVWTVLTYMSPAILAETVMLINYNKGFNALHFLLATVLANLAGTYGSNLLFFRLSALPLLFTMLAAALSGALGGMLGYYTYTQAIKSGIIKRLTKGKRKTKTENNMNEGGSSAHDKSAIVEEEHKNDKEN